MTLNIPYCNGSCTLQDFVSVVTPLIPENWEAECNLDYDERTTTSTSSSTSASSYPPSWSFTNSPTEDHLEKWTPPSEAPHRSGESGKGTDLNKSESDLNAEDAKLANPSLNSLH